ncbi:putative transcription factor C2H2 family [Helianthus annuus]|nr:putative transcription factor C2H2 family [Helianthus annuus]
MRCNACWRELEGRAISTTCGHILLNGNKLSLMAPKGNEDASKILSNDGACPICDQVLSKSLMRPVDINPNDEWINHQVMKSSYKSIMFYIGQKELEMQYKMNRLVAQCRQKCETMQEKFTEKMEQVHTQYQKLAKRCQLAEQENENLSKDKQELQEKFSEKSRQKRKLDEMYDQLRSEYESVKRSAIQPANNFFSRTDHDLFASPANMMDNRDPMRKDWSVSTPDTPGPREDIWPQAARQNSSNSGPFDISASPPVKHSGIPVENRRPIGRPMFGGGGGGGVGGGGSSNPSMTLRNLVLSPMKRPQLSRNRPQLFT